MIIPKATVFPILVFVGLEITAQSFQATPRRHYAAVALACIPALASLALLYVDKMQGALLPPGSAVELPPPLKAEIATLRVMANGFVVTSLIWASLLAALIDRRLLRGAAFSAMAGLFTLFGVIHSPLVGNPVFLPWRLNEADRGTTTSFACGYLSVAVLLFAWAALERISATDDSQSKPHLEDDPA